jgi:hypothetical protein
MSYGLKKIPVELRRLAAAAIAAGVVTTGVLFSRDKHDVLEVAVHAAKQAFPEDRQQAEGWFTPTPYAKLSDDKAVLSDDKATDIASVAPLPRSRPSIPGFYYELVRVQGDGLEGEYVLLPRQCIPKVDMPEPCYLPERDRPNSPLRRE